MASGINTQANVAHGTTAWVRRDAVATSQSRGWPTQGAGGAQGADTWQEATRTPVRGTTWQVGLAYGGPTG